jgi:hypothetical protein
VGHDTARMGARTTGDSHGDKAKWGSAAHDGACAGDGCGSEASGRPHGVVKSRRGEAGWGDFFRERWG